MKVDKILPEINKGFNQGEELRVLFYCYSMPKFWHYLLVGPLYALFTKHYLMVYTDKKLHLAQINLLNKLINIQKIDLKHIKLCVKKDGRFMKVLIFDLGNQKLEVNVGFRKEKVNEAFLSMDELVYLKSKFSVN